MHRIKKTISDVLDGRHPTLVGLDDTLAAGLLKLRASHPACLLVVDGERLVGIFTRRDVLNRVVGRELDPAAVTMQQVMTTEPETLREKDCITYAINKMVVGGFRNVPIVDDVGRPVAVIDVTHVIDHMSEVFAEVDGETEDDPLESEWVDLGGG